MIQSEDSNFLDQSTRSVSSASSCNSAQAVAGEPKRPLSAYNIFFIFQRKRIVDDVPSDRVITMDEVIDFMKHQRMIRGLPQPKRVHRKTHGKIGFREMARFLAEKWKKICPTEKQIYYKLAEIEKQNYIAYMKEFNMNKNNVISINDGDDDERAIISEDSSRSDAYGTSVVTTVPQIVMSENEFESIPQASEEDNNLEIYQDDEVDNVLSYDIYKSRQVIHHNLSLIQYQKVKLRRVKLQMEMLALNQRKLQLMNMMKHKKRSSLNTTTSSSSIESMKRKQQFSMMHHSSSNTEWTQLTSVDNSINVIGDRNRWNFENQMNDNDVDSNNPNDLLHEVSEATTNINDVHDVAVDRMYSVTSLNEFNDQDLITNSDDLVRFVNGFQDNDSY